MRFNCHTHIFNLKSVFTKETVATLVDRLARDKWPEFAVKAANKAVQKVISGEKLTEEALLRELVGAMKADKALQGLVDSGLAKFPPSVSVALEGDIAGLPVGALREILGKVGRSLEAMDDEDWRRGDLGDLVAFLAIGIKPSIEAVAAKLLEFSGEDTAVVALMMDITAGKDEDDALFQRQIEDTARTALAFPGRVLPFVAVNTRRTLHYERMTFALEEKGFVGVKLYPSLGYEVVSPEMDRVYRYCVEHETPLLMHCNRGGFFRNLAAVEHCDPLHWRKILKKFPDLKICFGHFGGDENFLGDRIKPDSWTGRILALMDDYPGVYADISYHDDPMDGGPNETNYFDRLTEILDDSKRGARVLFGSDYHLVRQRVRDDNLWRFFENRISPKHFRAICEANPVRYLGLPNSAGKGAKENIERHLRFLAKYNHGVKEQPADWAKSAIAATLGPVEFFPNPFGADWTENNEAHYYTEQFFRERAGEEAQKLSFTGLGQLRMRDLPYWPSQDLPDGERQDQFETTARRLHSYLTHKPEPAAVPEKDVNFEKAEAELLRLLGDPDTQVAAFGPAVNDLYRFKSES